MRKKLTVIGSVLWILGLAASIVGLNLPGDTGRWLSICGNIVFLAGLGIVGALWLKNRRDDKKE